MTQVCNKSSACILLKTQDNLAKLLMRSDPVNEKLWRGRFTSSLKEDLENCRRQY